MMMMMMMISTAIADTDADITFGRLLLFASKESGLWVRLCCCCDQSLRSLSLVGHASAGIDPRFNDFEELIIQTFV
jgi:hypothetical protein